MKKLIILLLTILNFNTFADEDNDPFESVNRVIFDFNTTIDENVLVPISATYKEYTPEPVQSGVSNFFNNLDEVPTFFNQLLQLKIGESADTLFRFTINSTIGLGGLVDVMGAEGIEKESEDFGQTLGHYGVPSGPYLVVPFLGPSSIRDVAATPIDNQAKINLNLSSEENILKNSIGVINNRTKLLDTTKVLYDSEDPYTKVRSSYLQNREHQINDGEVNTNDIDF